jgi:hypothetical protein
MRRLGIGLDSDEEAESEIGRAGPDQAGPVLSSSSV